jgi:hypothetical protein
MVSSAVEEGRHRCLLLERLVQALETNRVLLQRRASRAEARALRVEALDACCTAEAPPH